MFISGVRVADSSNTMHLYETGLPARFYMPLTDVDVGVLRRSATRTLCPYKGEAEYYSVELGEGKGVWEDVVWFYERPTLESARIEGEFFFLSLKFSLGVWVFLSWFAGDGCCVVLGVDR